MVSQDQELSRLLREIGLHERKRQTAEHSVAKANIRECEEIVEIGRRLAYIRDKKLYRGKWKKWASANLPFDYSMAADYMRVASKVGTFRLFFPLGKSKVYELLEVPEEKLKGLTPNSVIKGKTLRAMSCREVCRVFSKKPPKPRTYAHDYIKYLATIKKNNPRLWGEIYDDIAALLYDGQMETQSSTGKLHGKTREERGLEVLKIMREAHDVIDDVDDVPGKLPKEIKREAMKLAQMIWREVNRLPAYAVLPKKSSKKNPGA